jgi:hypothetical protein
VTLNLTKRSEAQSSPSQLLSSGIPLSRHGSSDGGESEAAVVTPLTSSDLMSGDPLRELILIGGKDGVGKTCAIVSMAVQVELMDPSAKFYVIDSENKFKSAMRAFGADAPSNIMYYQVKDMNQITATTRQIVEEHSPGDWLAVESMSRIWEKAQDLGYMAVSGFTKPEYMEARRGEGKKAPVTPQPDQLWSITKGAHDGAFLDTLIQCNDLNVIMSTILSKPPKEGGFMKESPERRALRMELGIDVGLEGAPRLPYYVETLILFDMKNGNVTCRILRDNLSALEDSRVEFLIEGRKGWASTFWAECR